MQLLEDLHNRTISTKVLNTAGILFCYFSTLLFILSLTQLLLSVNDTYPDAYQWVLDVWFIGKRTQVIYFILSILVTFFFLALEFIKKKKDDEVLGTIRFSVLVETCLWYVTSTIFQLVCSKFITEVMDGTYIAKMQVVWAVLCVQVLFFTTIYILGKFFYNKKSNFAYYSILNRIKFLIKILKTRATVYFMFAVGIIAYFYIYSPLLFSKMDFINEYLNIPSHYRSVEVHKLCRGDSIDCINEIKPLGIKIRKYNQDDTSISRPHIKVLEDQIAAVKNLVKKNKTSLYYDQFSKTLLSMSELSSSTVNDLYKIYSENKSFVDQFVDQTDLREKTKKEKLDPGQKKVLSASEFNLHWQILSRWYFHHHNFVWGPVLSYLSNKSDVFFQYGKYGALVQYYLVMLTYGKFNITNYFIVWSVLFFLYFAIFLVIVYKITKDIFLTTGAVLLFVSFVFTQQYEYIFLGPGLNPIRHFFDIVALFNLYKYFNTNKNRFAFFSLLSTLLGFILNPEFGILLAGSISFALIIDAYNNKKIKFTSSLVFIVFWALILCLWYYLSKGKDNTITNYLGGFFSPVTSYGNLLKFLGIIFIIGLWATSATKKTKNNVFVFLIACFSYLLLLSLYPLFGVSWNHIVNISPVIVLCATVLIHCLGIYLTEYSHRLKVGFYFLGLIFIVPSASFFLSTKEKYNKEISNFSLYEWSDLGEKNKFQLKESIIIDSCNMIKQNGIKDSVYIFSQYENLIQIIFGLSNRFGTHELATSLYTKKDYDRFLNKFNAELPVYILTDLNIASPHVDELIDYNTYKIGHLHNESKMRLQRIGLVQEMFKRIKHNYEMKDKSQLLMLWKKKL